MSSVSKKKKGAEPRRGSARSTVLRPSVSARRPPGASKRRHRLSGRFSTPPPSALSLFCSLESPIGRYGARKPSGGRSRPPSASDGSHLPLFPSLSLFLSFRSLFVGTAGVPILLAESCRFSAGPVRDGVYRLVRHGMANHSGNSSVFSNLFLLESS